MKKTFLIALSFCATALIYVSCGNDSDEIVNQTDTSAVGASILIDAVNEIDLKAGLLATTDNSTTKPAEVGPITCTTITVEKTTAADYPKVFTVDYGSGCVVNQISRKGKLRITLTAPVVNTGSKMTIERIGYSINGLQLEGTIEYTNTTTDQTVPKWTRKVSNGKLTNLLGRVYTNSGNYTVKQTAGVSTLTLDDNVYEITEGTHNVTSDNGASVTLTVKESLIKKYSCDFISKGALTIKGGFLNGVVDYGNGDCDRNYTYSQENGQSYNLSM